MNIRQIIFNRFLARQPRHESAYPDFQKVTSVFLLYESEWMERNPEIRAIVQQLHDTDKQVVSWGYIKKDKIISPNLPESRVLGLKDCNLWHKPKLDVQQFLQRHEFDILIDLTTIPVLQMQYVALLSQAKFKIGAHPSPIYDMVVQCGQGVSAEYIFQQTMHYLSTIKSAD